MITEPKKIYEDEYLLAFVKPRGFLTVAVNKTDPNLYKFVKQRYSDGKNKIMAMHRLDRDASGIVLFSKTGKCYEEAVEKRKFDSVKKVYLAVISGIPHQRKGIISKPLPSRRDRKILIPAQTSYRVLKTYLLPKREFASLVEIEITHGRKHQIRKHFAMIKHPLLMDREYMERRDYKYFQSFIKLRHFFLHAKKLSFRHFVTDKYVEIDTGFPAELKEVEQKILAAKHNPTHK